MDAVIIPIKSFRTGKQRLGTVLSDDARYELIVTMANTVVEACRPMDIFILSHDDEVSAWAKSLGLGELSDTGSGLNPAIQSAYCQLSSRRGGYVIVIHSDLPRAHDINSIPKSKGLTLVPDRHHLGTNLLRIPLSTEFQFKYGIDSFAAHSKEAKRLGIELFVYETEAIGFDVDEPRDWEIMEKLNKL